MYLNIFKTLIDQELATSILYLISIGTLLLPLITFFLLLNTKVINNLRLENNRERIIPIFLTGIYIFITVKLLMNSSIDSPLNSYLIGIVVTLSWILIFSRRMKVSLHAASISSGLGFIIFLSYSFFINLTPIIILLILLTGLISTSRLKLDAHNGLEIYLGILFGVAPQVGLIFL